MNKYKNKFRVLCLTDHDKHSKENSIYALLSKMLVSDRCKEVVVASRSAELNKDFFYNHTFDTIHGHGVRAEFNYQNAQQDLHTKIEAYNPRDFDIIFLRLPRPVTDAFLKALETTFTDQCIINKPSGIITCSSKAVLVNFPEVCPPIKLCRSPKEVLSFASQFDTVIKPLKEYGGKGIVKIINNVVNDGTQNLFIETYLNTMHEEIHNEGVLAMKYLKNVNQGDKRLIVVGGQVLAASLRMPPENSWLCNVSMGGTSISSEPDVDELKIIESINPFLLEKGILIYGADTLVNDDGKRILSEINALSIGGFPQAEKQTGLPIIQLTIDKIFDYACRL